MGPIIAKIRPLVLVLLFFIGASAIAAQVTKVKGKGVLIGLSGEAAMPGDKYFLLNSAGKKKAIVQITKVKGGQALGRVTAGKAEVGMSLVRGSSGGGGSAVASHSSHRDSGYSGRGFLRSRSYWGPMIGYGMDSMAVDLNTTPARSTSMSGSAFSVNGFFDYQLFERVWFRGAAGYQGFNVKSSDSCPNTTGGCNANISYADFTFLGRYLFTDTAFRPWAGAGFDLIFPISKSSTALDSGSINTTGVIVITAGFDYSINPNMYIPVSIEYGLFPHSSSVNADWITARIGLAWPF